MTAAPRPRGAVIVVDLGFGDAGKGTVTDFLVRERGASLVVRFNGGAQAGHNVVLDDGRHHTFAQLGAGTFVPGVGTHLGPAFLLHPGGLLVEAAHLARKGVPDALERLTVDGRAPVITPFQQAAGRLRELLRGERAHGTCGVGIGECVADADRDDALVAADLRDPHRLRDRLRRQQERKRAELDATALQDPRALPERLLLDDPGAVDRVLAAWLPAAVLAVLDPDAADLRVREASQVVLEGAQGVLLDERWGFAPHTTWSDCTPRGARALLAGHDREVATLGVTRAYAVRHGRGPFPTDGTLAIPEPHNDDRGWQGRFRTGALDLPLLRYAAGACGGLDGLAVTCLDLVPDRAPVCTSYERPFDPATVGAARPRLEAVPADRLPELAAEAVGAPLRLTSRGPTASSKRLR